MKWWKIAAIAVGVSASARQASKDFYREVRIGDARAAVEASAKRRGLYPISDGSDVFPRWYGYQTDQWGFFGSFRSDWISVAVYYDRRDRVVRITPPVTLSAAI